MGKQIRTIILVTIVTCLIWLYAEQENPAQPLEDDVVIKLVVPPQSDLIGHLKDDDQKYHILVQGPTKSLASIRQNLLNSGKQVTLTIGKELPATLGNQTIGVEDALAKNEWFEKAGVHITVQGASSIVWFADVLKAMTLPVIPGDLGNVEVEPPIKCDPDTVTFKIASSLLKDQPDGKNLRLVADPDSRQLENLSEGQTASILATLKLEGISYVKDEVRLPLDHVTMSFRVKSRQVELTRNSVPIKLVITPLDQHYQVSLAETVIPEVRLQGPSEMMKSINDGTTKVFAYLDLTSDDFQKGITEKNVQFSLPGVTILSGPFTVHFTIVDRAQQSPTIEPNKSSDNGAGPGGG